MIKYNKIKTSLLVSLSALMVTLTACSSSYTNSNARAMPQIPEIRSNAPRSRPAPRKAIAKPKPPVAKVKKYSITSNVSTVITQTEVAAVNEDLLRMEAKKKVMVDVDPYASIPENSSSNNHPPLVKPSLPSSGSNASPAVKSLMTRARADLAIGKTSSAVSKLERGLRIESQNPQIWALLAKAHYDQRDFQQAISMAKRSIRYTDNDRLIAENWQLIKKAGEKSDDAVVIKEALDYFKVNP